jgi:hypothetical protein
MQILKKIVHNVAPGIVVSLEEGSLGKLSLCVPWLLTGLNRVEVVADSFDAVIRIEFPEPDSTPVQQDGDSTTLPLHFSENSMMVCTVCM